MYSRSGTVPFLRPVPCRTGRTTVRQYGTAPLRQYGTAKGNISTFSVTDCVFANFSRFLALFRVICTSVRYDGVDTGRQFSTMGLVRYGNTVRWGRHDTAVRFGGASTMRQYGGVGTEVRYSWVGTAVQ